MCPLALQGLTDFRTFPARASFQPLELIPRPPALQLALPGPQLLPRLVPTQLPPLGLGSCFLFFLSKPYLPLVGCVGSGLYNPLQPLPPAPEGLAACQTHQSIRG